MAYRLYACSVCDTTALLQLQLPLVALYKCSAFTLFYVLLCRYVLQTSSGADRLPAAEQPARVLVHGGLCASELPRHADRVLQHVRAADHERSVQGQHAGGHKTHALQIARIAQPARRICSTVCGYHLFIRIMHLMC